MRTDQPETTARTGENCPESGLWRVCSAPENQAGIREGDIMPPYQGRAVTWVLVSRD